MLSSIQFCNKINFFVKIFPKILLAKIGAVHGKRSVFFVKYSLVHHSLLILYKVSLNRIFPKSKKVSKLLLRVPKDKLVSESTKSALRCVIRDIIARIHSLILTALFFFPCCQKPRIYSPYTPRISPSMRLLNVRFRLLSSEHGTFMLLLLAHFFQLYAQFLLSKF